MRDILITGIPRGGTTLAASLLDAQPDSVCLNEPEWHRPHPSLLAADFVNAVAQDMQELRKKLLGGVPVPDLRAAGGGAVTNYYEHGMNITPQPFTRAGLTEDFTLGIKHNGPYLAVLPELTAHGGFEIRAVIRHPLPVLRSWRRLNLPVSRGELPNATLYWPQMKTLTEAKMPLLEKQVRMVELMLARILEYAPKITLLRYEDFATDRAQASNNPTPEDEAILEAIAKFAPQGLNYY